MKRTSPGGALGTARALTALAVSLIAPTCLCASEPVMARVESNAPTALPRIRQHAFDGDPATDFASSRNAQVGDQLTLWFEKPIKTHKIEVATGRLDAGSLEISRNGRTFEKVAAFTKGAAHWATEKQGVSAVRVICDRAMDHPFVVREIVSDSQPRVARFDYPVEFVLDCQDAPRMLPWLEKAARICEREYPMINRELASAGFKPPQIIHMALKSSYEGVAATSGDRIVGSVEYFRRNLHDFGAMVHETTHVVQHYQGGDNPGWLVEGVSDYVRFFKYEPGHLGPISRESARYDHGYRESAAFLAFLVHQYDPTIVLKLNAAMRQGTYKESIFETLTKKSLPSLGEEWLGAAPGRARKQEVKTSP